MDELRFDQFTQRFARGVSRRGLGQVLASLSLTAGLAVAPKATAKRKKKKKCKNGTARCGKACVNLSNNPVHCGACGNACAGQICLNGACQNGNPGDGCPVGQARCDGLCVDLRDNEQHCGVCGTACAGELTCLNGTCGCVTGTACGTACVDTQTDDAHCGGCNTPCGSGTHCVSGTCESGGCGAGQRVCGTECIPDTPDACCVALDCGPSRSGNDIQCNGATHRCECRLSRLGICSRHSDNGGTCGFCCPGGDQTCPGDMQCLTPTETGCGCPPGAPVSCGNGLCSINTQSDPERCGPNCNDCTQGGTATAGCCSGVCVGLAGCEPGVFSSSCLNSPCGSCGNICSGDTPMCCNDGAGTSGVCKAPLSGGACPPPAGRQAPHHAARSHGRRARGRRQRRN